MTTIMRPDDVRHGSTAGYHAGCRCNECREALCRYEKRTKFRRANGITWAIPSLGSQRRLQALMALGWNAEAIALAAGWNHRNSVWHILHGQNGKPCRYVERKTHAKVAEVYELLSMKLPPETTAGEKSAVARSRNLAIRRGWAPPLAWNNPDDPNETPTDWAYTPADRGELVDDMLQSGATLSDVLRHLKINAEALEKWMDRTGRRAAFNRLLARERGVA